MSRRFGLPLAASLLGHGALLVLLVFLMARLPPAPLSLSVPKRGIEILLATPPAPAAARLPEPLPPEPPPVAKPEPAPPPAPPPPVLNTRPPPARHAPARARPAPLPRHPTPAYEAAPEPQVAAPPPPPPALPAPPRPAAPAPALAPSAPAVSAGYRAALSAWLERHKQYPETARARGEEGQAVLRFRVDRSGRVLGYAIIRSTGYADLDAAVDRMMRAAVLPPFPTDMTASEIDVSVPVRFALAR